MKYQEVKKLLLNKPEAELDYPFGPDVEVFKIQKKMFATIGRHEGYDRINLKCDPDEALALRDIFDAVIPGYHMNKKHWNTIILDGSIPTFEIERMIDNSYALVVKSLTRKQRQGLELRSQHD